jgi:hypothetical protein
MNLCPRGYTQEKRKYDRIFRGDEPLLKMQEEGV